MKAPLQHSLFLTLWSCAIALGSFPIAVVSAQEVLSAESYSTPSLYTFTDDFESGNTGEWNYTGIWGKTSTVSVRYDQAAGGNILAATAEKATNRVGKAYLTKDTIAMTRGDVVEVSARVYVPKPARGIDSIYLLDLECRDCGYDAKPGLRVLIDKNGYLRVNRSKLGISEEFCSVVKVPYNRKFTLSLIMTLGQDEGTTQVFIDNALVLDGYGINMPLAAVVEKYGIDLTSERLDYVQIGVTANSGSVAATAYFDDFRIDIMKQ